MVGVILQLQLLLWESWVSFIGFLGMVVFVIMWLFGVEIGVFDGCEQFGVCYGLWVESYFGFSCFQ